MLQIAHDRELSTEIKPVYYVYDTADNAIVYTGSYSQCLVIVGAVALDSDITLSEINNRTDGYLCMGRETVMK